MVQYRRESAYKLTGLATGVGVEHFNKNSYDFRVHGDRRMGDRRGDYERRGILRWDPMKKERRSGKDRRAGGAGMSRGG